jgi:hypothetical protein
MLLNLNLASVGVLFITAVIFFVLGFLIKNALVAKLRKRILNLEDEMLSDHATILALEKEIADIKVEQQEKNKAKPDYDLGARKTDHGLKAS